MLRACLAIFIHTSTFYLIIIKIFNKFDIERFKKNGGLFSYITNRPKLQYKIRNS